MTDPLPHTTVVSYLLRAGRIHAAKVMHNARVRQQLEKARTGGIINLSDLMSAKEEIDLAEEH